MKRIIASLAFLFIASASSADWDDAQKIEMGRFAETAVFTVSTVTASRSNIVPSDTDDASLFILNHSSFTVFIGTDTATLESTGYPVYSSDTFRVEGMFTGPLYAITEASAGAGTASVRVMRFKMK